MKKGMDDMWTLNYAIIWRYRQKSAIVLHDSAEV
jgi:hypothetical protein